MAHKRYAHRLRADLSMLLAAMIWGGAFATNRVAAEFIPVYLFNGLRFLIGAGVLLPIVLWQRKPFNRRYLPGLLLLGFILYFGAAMQQTGLNYTTASNAGFITGLYVVFTPLVLVIGWRHRSRFSIWLASLLATVGLFLLSTQGHFRLSPGDGLELLGAVMWTFHVILTGWVVKHADVFQVAIVQYLVCSLLSLLTSRLGGEGLAGIGAVQAWGAIVYTGVFSIGLAYTLQGFAQKVAPPADAAIILSMEAAFAGLCGWLFLGEILSGIQLIGCALMLAGMLLAQLDVLNV